MNIYAANIIIQVNVKVCYRNLQMLGNVNFSLMLIRCILKNGLFMNIPNCCVGMYVMEWFDGSVIWEESNGWHCLRGLRLLLWEAVISHFLSSSAPYESPLISSGLGLITSTERHGNTAEMWYLAPLGRDSNFFKLPLTALLTDRWLCEWGASAGLIYGRAGGFILW